MSRFFALPIPRQLPRRKNEATTPALAHSRGRRFSGAARPDTRRSARAGARKKSAHSAGQDRGGTSRRSAPCFPFHRADPSRQSGCPWACKGASAPDNRRTEPFALARGSFRQPLFQAAIPASLRRGDIEVLVAAQELNVAVVEQLHQVRTAFYTALYDRSLEELGRSQRQRLDENLTSEKARYEAGTVDRGALAAATLQARELDPQIEECASGLRRRDPATGDGDGRRSRSRGGLAFAAGNPRFPAREFSAGKRDSRRPRAARRSPTGPPSCPRQPRRSTNRRSRFLSAPRSHSLRPIHPENQPSPARLVQREHH